MAADASWPSCGCCPSAGVDMERRLAFSSCPTSILEENWCLGEAVAVADVNKNKRKAVDEFQ